MRYLLMFLTLLVGGLMPVQAVLNTRLGRQIGGPLMGSLMSFTVGLICLLVLNLAINTSAVINLKVASTGPWYIWLGGFIGAIFVGYITWVNQQQGIALTFALAISGQMFLSLMIDHYGLFGAAVRTITLEKIIGVGLIICGIVLIKK
ncbi:MAG TPA: DMT family transporter [Parafilimonas sp.]|nr:DMT family transporter [Parafilimonas sp.]